MTRLDYKKTIFIILSYFKILFVGNGDIQHCYVYYK